MATSSRFKMLWRIPLVAAIITALFWGVWYLVEGNIPEATTSEGYGFAVIVRLYDPAFAFMWAWIITFIVSWLVRNRNEDVDAKAAISVAFVLTLVCALVGTINNAGTGLGVGLGIGVLVSLAVIGDSKTETEKISGAAHASLGSGIGIGLIFSFLAGMGNGLIVAIGSAAAIVGATTLIVAVWLLICFIFKLTWNCILYIFSKQFAGWLGGK